MSRDQATVGVEEEFLLSNKQLDDKELSWQFGSAGSCSLDCSSQYILVEKNPLLEFNDISPVMTRKKIDCGRPADIELEWQWIVHEQESSKCKSLSCPYCNETKANKSSSLVHDGEVYESRSAQLFSSELLAAHCAIKGFNQWHVHESSNLCSVASQNGGQYITRPLSAQCISLASSSLSEYDQEQQKETHFSSTPSSKCIGDHFFPSPRFQSAPQPDVGLTWQNQHGKLRQNSLGSRSTSLSKDENVAEKPEKLGAALCHSQTRARNAEKLATEVLQEKEKLAKLFFNEASTCHMYKRRVHLLELENSWLKRHSEDDSKMDDTKLAGYFNASHLRHCKYSKNGSSVRGPSVPGTFGLAFALGLSCASVGFIMIGCCIGLVGLSR